MPNIDVSSLTSALEDLYYTETYIHSWTGTTKDDTPSIDIEGIYIQGIGALKFPPTLEDITNVTGALTKQGDVNMQCRIDSSKIFPIPKGTEPIAQMTHKLGCYSLEKMLNIDFANLNANFHATLDGLAICQNGQSYKNTLAYRREPGDFATLILQVPLESAQPSGRLVLRDGFKEIKTDNLAANGQRNQYFALLSSSYCIDRARDYFIQADTSDGVVLALIFNLVWTDYFRLSQFFHADCYPHLLIIADKIAKLLLPSDGTSELSESQKDEGEEEHSNGYEDIDGQVPSDSDLQDQAETEEESLGDLHYEEGVSDILSDSQSQEEKESETEGPNSEDTDNETSSDCGVSSRFICMTIDHDTFDEENNKSITLQNLKPSDLAMLLIAADIIKFTDASIGYMDLVDDTISHEDLPLDIDDYFSFSDLFSLDYPPIFELTDDRLSTRWIDNEQIIDTPWSYRYSSVGDLINIPILLVYRRESKFKKCHNVIQSICEEECHTVVELLVNMENCLARYEAELLLQKNGARHTLMETLLANLDCLVNKFVASCDEDTIDSLAEYCLVCLSFRILKICMFLKAPNQGFLVLETLSKRTGIFTDGFKTYCDCSDDRISYTFLLASFLRFACYNEGGLSDPAHPTTTLIRLIQENLSKENYHDYSMLGLHLYLHGCVEDAFFIVDHTLLILTKSSIPLVEFDSQDDEGNFKGMDFIDLALRLYNDQQNTASEKTFEQMLALSDNLPESSLTALVKFLGESIETGRLDGSNFLILLGNRIIQKGAQQFTSSQNFLSVIRVYKQRKEFDKVKLLWEKVCSDCIANTESNQPCLLCSILRESLPEIDERDDLLKTLSHASNANQAITSSSEKWNRIQSMEGTTAGCFLYSVSLLNDEPQLSDESRLKSLLNTVLPKLDNKALCDAAWFFFTSATGIFNKHSSVRRVFEDALKRITSLQGLEDKFIFKTFRMFAWLGDVNLVKTMHEKIILEASHFSEQGNESCLRLVFSAMKARSGGNTYDACSALIFDRNVFNFLLSKCLANIEVLEFARASYFVRAFKSFLAAEKNFIDSSEPNVTEAFSRVVQRFEPYEAMKILKLLYLHEKKNAETEPSLKKFPPCWRVFQELSKKAIDYFNRQSFFPDGFFLRDVVTLMHCFFYIGEKELIVKFCDFVGEQCGVSQENCLSNMDRAIISHPKTVTLALTTPHGIVGINELIDNRIRRLSSRRNNEKEFRRLKTLRRTILLRLTQAKGN